MTGLKYPITLLIIPNYLYSSILNFPPSIMDSFISFSLKYCFTDTDASSLSISIIGACFAFVSYGASSASGYAVLFANITLSVSLFTAFATSSAVSTRVLPASLLVFSPSFLSCDAIVSDT